MGELPASWDLDRPALYERPIGVRRDDCGSVSPGRVVGRDPGTRHTRNKIGDAEHHRHPLLLGRPAFPPNGAARSRPGRCPATSSTPAPQPTPMLPTRTRPTGPRASPPPCGMPPACSTRSSATPPSCPSPSTLPTPRCQTLATLGVFDLLGLRFSPRIRDLPSLRLYRTVPTSELSSWPRAGRLLTEPIQRQLIVDHWEDLLRLAGSLNFGRATASLVLRRLHAGRRHGSLARAVVDYGRLVRTVFVQVDPDPRRRARREGPRRLLQAGRRDPARPPLLPAGQRQGDRGSPTPRARLATPTHRKGFSFHPLLCHLDVTGDALRGCCGGETPAPTLPSHKAKVVRLYVPCGVFSSRRSSKRTAQSEGSIRRYLADFRQILRPAGTRATPRPRASPEA